LYSSPNLSNAYGATEAKPPVSRFFYHPRCVWLTLPVYRAVFHLEDGIDPV
jgi:hypothetical protein